MKDNKYVRIDSYKFNYDRFFRLKFVVQRERHTPFIDKMIPLIVYAYAIPRGAGEVLAGHVAPGKQLAYSTVIAYLFFYMTNVNKPQIWI